MTPPRWPTKWSHGNGLPRWYDTSVQWSCFVSVHTWHIDTYCTSQHVCEYMTKVTLSHGWFCFGWNWMEHKVLWSMWSHHTAIHRHEWRTLHVHVGFEASLPAPATFRFLKLNFSLLENVHVACSSLVYCWQVRLQPALGSRHQLSNLHPAPFLGTRRYKNGTSI